LTRLINKNSEKTLVAYLNGIKVKRLCK